MDMIRKTFAKEINSEDVIKSQRIEDIAKRINDYIYDAKHYSGEIETIDFIRDKLTGEEFLGYCKGNCIKYLGRIKQKEDEEEKVKDIRKAFTYILILLDEIHTIKNENEEYNP